MQPVTLLDVKGLSVTHHHTQGKVRLLKDLDFKLLEGKSLGLVGESGSGKSLTAMALLRLLPWPQLMIESGSILFQGRDLMEASEAEMGRLRGQHMAVVFQDPLASLNPVRSLGSQLDEVFTFHQPLTSRLERRQRIVDCMRQLGLGDVESKLKQFPHQLSGGMRQRFLLCMAILLRPRLLIADEPSTALDVVSQSKLIKILQKMQQDEQVSILFISHDLGVLAEICEDTAVLYKGALIEKASTRELLDEPWHPYSRAMVAALKREQSAPKERLHEVQGCAFQGACPHVQAQCRQYSPNLRLIAGERWVACHRVEELIL